MDLNAHELLGHDQGVIGIFMSLSKVAQKGGKKKKIQINRSRITQSSYNSSFLRLLKGATYQLSFSPSNFPLNFSLFFNFPNLSNSSFWALEESHHDCSKKKKKNPIINKLKALQSPKSVHQLKSKQNSTFTSFQKIFG